MTEKIENAVRYIVECTDKHGDHKYVCGCGYCDEPSSAETMTFNGAMAAIYQHRQTMESVPTGVGMGNGQHLLVGFELVRVDMQFHRVKVANEKGIVIEER